MKAAAKSLAVLISFSLIIGTISSCKKKDKEEPEPELDSQTKQFND